MKIAFFHELHRGGARRGTNEFAKQLKKKHEVDLYTIDNILEEERNFYSNIYHFNFTPKVWKGNDWKTRLYKDTVELVKLWKLNKQIADEINNKNYDIAYVTASQFIESPFILNFLNIPKYYYLNDPYYRMIYEPSLFNPKRKGIIRNIYENLNSFIRKTIDKFNISKVDYVLAASNFTMEQFIRVYGKKKGTTAYYGVDSKFFYPKNTKKDIDILFIGSYDLLDGYPLFQEIFKEIKTKAKVRTVLVENEWLNDRELRDLYRRTKILLTTSYNEPLGLIPLEAMSCGAVVLAVDEAGHKETVVDGKTGYLIKRDKRKFAEKIDFLLKNESIIKKMSECAIKNTHVNWNWEKRGNELNMILEKK